MKKKVIIYGCICLVVSAVIFGIIMFIRILNVPGVYSTTSTGNTLSEFTLNDDNTCDLYFNCKWSSDGFKVYVTYYFNENENTKNEIKFTIKNDELVGLNKIFKKEISNGES